MFDRCDPDAMVVVDSAIDAARNFGHNYIGTEHVLLSFAEHRALLPAAVHGMLPTADDVRTAIAAVIGEPARRDADVLRAVGIDLDEVRATVRRTFGDEAVDRLGRRRVHQPWQPWRRPSRRCTSVLAGTMTVAPRVKQALERAWREAEQRRELAIRPSLLLLGIVEVEDALANRLLRENGVDPDGIRALLSSEL